MANRKGKRETQPKPTNPAQSIINPAAHSLPAAQSTHSFSRNGPAPWPSWFLRTTRPAPFQPAPHLALPRSLTPWPHTAGPSPSSARYPRRTPSAPLSPCSLAAPWPRSAPCALPRPWPARQPAHPFRKLLPSSDHAKSLSAIRFPRETITAAIPAPIKPGTRAKRTGIPLTSTCNPPRTLPPSRSPNHSRGRPLHRCSKQNNPPPQVSISPELLAADDFWPALTHLPTSQAHPTSSRAAQTSGGPLPRPVSDSVRAPPLGPRRRPPLRRISA